MRTLSVPVLVVGGGPVGLATGMFLAHWGVRPMLIDKRDPMSAPPRAGVSLRTLELFRSVGLEPALQQAGWEGGRPMRTIFKDAGLGDTLHRSGLPPRYTRRLENCSPANHRLLVMQDQVQKVVMAELLRREGQVRFDTRLLDVEAGEDHVRARVADTRTGEQWEITAAHLIAADGANSDIRERLGITVPDREVLTRLNTAFFRADLGPVAQEWGTHFCLVRNDRVYATLLSKNGRDQWSSHIMDYPGKPEELTELSADKTIDLLHAVIGDTTIPIELHEVNAWEAAYGIAASFRKGRVFLAGDAAHVQSSAGGLGMNTGIQDGHNLAWKLAAVLRGQASPALLDTYEPERRAAARASVALSLGMHRGYNALEGDPDATYEKIAVDYLRGMMFYGYPPHHRAEPDVLNDVVRPGYRYPHQRLDDGASTLDLIGSHWTLFTGPDGHRWSETVTSASIDLRTHQVNDTDEAVLVRPDGFVAWRGAATGGLRDALHGLLADDSQAGH